MTESSAWTYDQQIMNYDNALKKGVLLLLLAFLTACQHGFKPASETDSWLSDKAYFSQFDQTRAALKQWRYSAKVGLRSASLKEQANLIWRYGDQSHDVRLFGPLGVGAIKLEFDDYGVQLSDSKGVLYQGTSAEHLLTEIVGWPLPIDALSHWLFLLPSPSHPFQYQLNAQGQLASIRQLGWQINFAAYRDYQGEILPRTIIATKQFSDTSLDNVTVKLVTKSWHR